jgi:uncharacterized membrane protein
MVDMGDAGWLARRRRYRRGAFGILAAGVVGFAIGVSIDRPVVGVGLYWAGFVGFFALKRWSPIELFDERDCALERRASYDAVRLAGVAMVVFAPGASVLEETGSYEIPRAVEGAFLGYVALFAVFGIAYLARRYRP